MTSKFLKFFIIFFISIGLSAAIAQRLQAQSDFQLFFSDKTKYQDILAEEVLSADTFKLESGEKIKLIGLKAPEAPTKKKVERDEQGMVIVKKNKDPFLSFGEQAYQFAVDLLEGKRVRLEFDIEKNSPEGTPAYVFLLEENIFVNTEILRQGFADLQIHPPNVKYAQELRASYQEARKEKRGLQGE